MFPFWHILSLSPPLLPFLLLFSPGFTTSSPSHEGEYAFDALLSSNFPTFLLSSRHFHTSPYWLCCPLIATSPVFLTSFPEVDALEQNTLSLIDQLEWSHMCRSFTFSLIDPTHFQLLGSEPFPTTPASVRLFHMFVTLLFCISS